MKSWMRAGLCLGAAAVAIVGVSLEAAGPSWPTIKRGNFAGLGFSVSSFGCGGGFTSYYAGNMIDAPSQGKETFSKCSSPAPAGKLGQINLKWYGQGSASAPLDNIPDYVTGLGWGPAQASKSRVIEFYVNKFDSSLVSGGTFVHSVTMGVYGWLCPQQSGQERFEYYIVDGWLSNQGDGSFIPFDTEYKKTISSGGDNYKLYVSKNFRRANACTGGDADFRQIWAVRIGQKRLGYHRLNMANFVDGWNSISGVNLNAPTGYQLVGVEGVGATKGSFGATVF